MRDEFSRIHSAPTSSSSSSPLQSHHTDCLVSLVTLHFFLQTNTNSIEASGLPQNYSQEQNEGLRECT